jgi:hypothetical protein
LHVWPKLRFLPDFCVIFSEQVNYFENSKLHGSFKGVKGNLKKHTQYWKDIGANEFILGCPYEQIYLRHSNLKLSVSCQIFVLLHLRDLQRMA